MKILRVALALAAFGAPVVAFGDAWEDRFHAAAQAHDRCVVAQARRYLPLCEGPDDTARAVLAACGSTEQALLNVMSAGKISGADTGRLIDKIRQKRADWVIMQVLNRRLDGSCSPP